MLQAEIKQNSQQDKNARQQAGVPDHQAKADGAHIHG
jgi:hypothetical protein